MILGKISYRYSNGLELIIDGEDEPTNKVYRYLASYVPSNGDRVLIEEIGDSYVVLGKVIDQYSDSGKARTASTATNATNATYASYVKSYSGNYNVQFAYFNGDIWAKIGSTQFALAKK